MSKGLSNDQRTVLDLLRSGPLNVSTLADYVYFRDSDDVAGELERWRDVEFKRQRRKAMKRALASLEKRGLVRLSYVPDTGETCPMTGQKLRKRAGNGLITVAEVYPCPA